MDNLPELPIDWQLTLASLRASQKKIKDLPPDYDFVLPVVISHANEYKDDLPRLRSYARQVIGARIMQFGHTSLYKTYYFLEMFLRGHAEKNVYEMVFSARALIEVYAVVRDVYSVVADNVGDGDDNLLARVIAVDEALINATYGSRSEAFKQALPKIQLSKLRDVSDEDLSVMEAKNVLTRINRASRLEEYSECRADYDRLSEYVHPNTGQNIILCWPSPKNEQWVRVSRRSKHAFITAFRVSVAPANKSSKLILQHVLSGKFPFDGQVRAAGQLN